MSNWERRVCHLTKQATIPIIAFLGYDPGIGNTGSQHMTDVGLRFYLFKSHVKVSLTSYRGEESAQPFEIPFTNNIQDIALANKIGDTSSDGINQRGLPIVPRQAFDLRNRKNSGYEIEVTANVTRRWRLSANAATADGKQTNAWRDTRAFLAKWGDTIRQVVIDTGSVFNAAGQPVADGGSSGRCDGAERLDPHLQQSIAEHRRRSAENSRIDGDLRQSLHRLSVLRRTIERPQAGGRV